MTLAVHCLCSVAQERGLARVPRQRTVSRLATYNKVNSKHNSHQQLLQRP